MAGLPIADIDVAAALRVQLDESTAARVNDQHAIAARDQRIDALEAQVAQLNATIDELRATVQLAAEAAANDPAEARSSRFWFASWTNGNRRNAELALEVSTLKRRLDEESRRATNLQGERDAALEEAGRLGRQLAVARERKREAREVD